MNEDLYHYIEKYTQEQMYPDITTEYYTNNEYYVEDKVYTKSKHSINMDALLEKIKEAKEYEKRKREAAENKAAAEKEAALKALECFQPDVFKPFVNVLTSKLSEDDCRALCVLLFDVLSKDNKQITLSPSIETAILTFMINNQ